MLLTPLAHRRSSNSCSSRGARRATAKSRVHERCTTCRYRSSGAGCRTGRREGNKARSDRKGAFGINHDAGCRWAGNTFRARHDRTIAPPARPLHAPRSRRRGMGPASRAATRRTPASASVGLRSDDIDHRRVRYHITSPRKSTGLAWLHRAKSDVSDARRDFVSLTSKSNELLADYLARANSHLRDLVG